MRKRSPIALANEHVSILHACRKIGLSVPEELTGRSMKLSCPFGDVWHTDQGAQKALRLFPETNSAYCYAGCGFYTPVSLVAMAEDRDPEDVAIELLQEVGYKPVSLAQYWADVQVTEQSPDRAMLGLALRTYCERVVPGWSERQFDEQVARRLSRCLSLLAKVETEGDAELWLDTCKKAMGQVG